MPYKLRTNIHKEISEWINRYKYSPTQPRWPKGSPQGGKWRKSGVSGRIFDRLAIRGPVARITDIATLRVGFLAKGEGQAVKSVMRSINSVHKVRGLPNLAIHTVQNPSAPFFGAYHIGKNRITITSAGAHPYMTSAHEIGHFIDHAGFGWGSANSPKFAAWRKAVEASPTIKQWREWDRTGWIKVGRFRMPVGRSGKYYLHPREMWARSYAQYIARRSGNRNLLRDLRLLQNSHMRTQWPDSEFEAIAKEIDRLLSSEGWK